MGLFDQLAEQRLQEAVDAGLFRDLPGHGRPLELEDLSRVPEDLRAGYLLLKGAHVLPEEMQMRKELLRIEDLLSACTEGDERAELAAESRRLSLRYRLLMERAGTGGAAADYATALQDRLSGR